MQKKFLRTLKAAIAFSLVFSLSVPVFAGEKEEAQQKLSELQNQKAALEGRLAALEENKADTESYIAELDKELTAVMEEITRLTGELEQTQAALEQTQAELEVAKTEEAEQYEVLKLRIKSMYENGDTTLMEVFMQADDISTLLNASEYISKISDFDNALLEKLNQIRLEIERLEAQLQEQKNTLEMLKTEEEAKQEELELIMEAKQQELDAIVGDIGSAYDSIYATEAGIENMKEIIAAIEYQEALEEQRRQEQAAAGGNGGGSAAPPSGSTGGSSSSGSSSSGGSGFIWPCPGGGYISSGFGGRTSPTAGASSNHQGIDIAIGSGSAIVASASGTVTTAAYNTARGYYVVVSHGNGMATIYQHCSALYVSAGQSVSQGQTIAAVGSTGYSTGPHLHFEVLVGGVPQNPSNYV